MIQCYLLNYLTLAGSEFHTVGAATMKVRVPAFVFIRGMQRGLGPTTG